MLVEEFQELYNFIDYLIAIVWIEYIEVEIFCQTEENAKQHRTKNSK